MKKFMFAILVSMWGLIVMVLCYGCATKKAIVSQPLEVFVVPTSTPSPTSTPEEVQLKAAGLHSVVKGECLWLIAEKEYSDAFQWPMIFHQNREQISDPDIIEIGQRLVIPHLTFLVDSVRQEASDWPKYHPHKKLKKSRK